jgi:hypothetical protein
MAETRGMLGTKQLEAGISKLDVRDEIFLLEKEKGEAPFLTILAKVPKEKTTQTDFHWFEDELLGSYTQINHGAGYDAAATDLVVDDAMIFQQYDVAKNYNTGEVMLITTITDGTNTITVTRGWGTTAAAAITDNDYMIKLGNAQAEGWSVPTDPVTTQKAKKDNYLQTFSRPVIVTSHMENTEQYGGNRRNYERKKIGLELKREIEKQFLFGEPKEDTSGSQKRWQTGGVYYFIRNACAYYTAASSTMTEAEFLGFLKDFFTYGSSEKLLFCGPRIMSQISGYPSAAKMNLTPGMNKEYGIQVVRYFSALGIVNLVLNKLFVGPYAGMAIGLDMDDRTLVYRYLQNMDLTLNLDTGAPDAHKFVDEYFGTIGVEVHNAKRHGLIENVTD